jgi:catechol 2,3-dioxygenase-like lactoylglutathione lyase family enzyme
MLKLNHTSFYVSDLGKAMEFFGHLGFTEIRRVDVPHLQTVLSFIADASGGIIELMHIADRKETACRVPPVFGYAHLGLETDDIESVEAHLSDAGIHFREPVKHVPDGPKVAFIDGPDGITVEVVEYSRGD